MGCECSIKIMDITQRFGDKTVLKNIDLTLRKGEIFGLLGPSGAGENHPHQNPYRAACADRRKGGSAGDRYQSA